MSKTVHSYHTFMLPFTFKGSFLKKDNWIYKKFKVEEQKSYNEFTYFYKHVQDALYNKNNESYDSISKYYEYKVQTGSFIIKCIKGEYELELDGISLRVFNTDVAILSFNLKNTTYFKSKDILAINDFGRRIYPQFLGDSFTEETKNSILAQKITLKLDDKEIIDDFKSFDKVSNLDEIDYLPSYINELLTKNKNFTEKISPIIDDRMFVISQYNSDKLSKKLSTFDEKEASYKYESNDFWYKYLFIDGDYKTCQNKNLSKEYINNSTYARWVDYGTLFGISRYSFVSISNKSFGNEILLSHTQTMYFQIFTLLLAYRATIIKFANDIQDGTTTDDNVIKNAREIYGKYLKFLNKLFFKEVTAQDQGIEIYNQAMKIMDIDKYIKDLDHEINELHTYVNMIDDENKSKENEKIDNKLKEIELWGGVLLVASALSGIFGMNVGDEGNFSSWYVYPILFVALILGYFRFKKENHE